MVNAGITSLAMNCDVVAGLNYVSLCAARQIGVSGTHRAVEKSFVVLRALVEEELLIRVPHFLNEL